MVILGCLMAQAHVIIAATITDIPVHRSSKSEKMMLQSLLSVDLCLFCVNQILWNIAGVIAFVFTADLAKQYNLTKTEGSILMSLGGLSSVVICLLFGLVGKYIHMYVISLFALGHVIRGISIAVLPLTHVTVNHMWYSYLCSIGIGLGFGLQSGMLVPSIVQIFGHDQTPMITGISLMAAGIGSLGGAPLAGKT